MVVGNMIVVLVVRRLAVWRLWAICAGMGNHSARTMAGAPIHRSDIDRTVRRFHAGLDSSCLATGAVRWSCGHSGRIREAIANPPWIGGDSCTRWCDDKVGVFLTRLTTRLSSRCRVTLRGRCGGFGVVGTREVLISQITCQPDIYHRAHDDARSRANGSSAAWLDECSNGSANFCAANNSVSAVAV